MRIGVMGGSFDPVHTGHLIAAESVRESFELDRVIFIPAYQPPHKPRLPDAPPEVRLRMLSAAVNSNPAFEVSDIEIRREGPSYTLDTLLELGRIHPGSKLFFIIGSDLTSGLHRWHRWDILQTLAVFVSVYRPGAQIREEDIPSSVRPFLKQVEIPGVGISSTDIRERVRAGRSVRYLAPQEVCEIIDETGIYKNEQA